MATETNNDSGTPTLKDLPPRKFVPKTYDISSFDENLILPGGSALVHVITDPLHFKTSDTLYQVVIEENVNEDCEVELECHLVKDGQPMSIPLNKDISYCGSLMRPQDGILHIYIGHSLTTDELVNKLIPADATGVTDESKEDWERIRDAQKIGQTP